MTETGTPISPRRHPVRTAWHLHILCYLLLGGVLIYVLIDRYMKPLVFHQTIGIDSAREQLIQQRIDPNIAPWQELARLPDIGETMAKRIVAYRREQRPISDSVPVFSALEDLDPIKGIGPKTLVGIAPYLKFPNSDPQPNR